MEPTENQRKDFSKALRNFPRNHLLLAAGLGVCLGGLLALFPSENVTAKRHSVPLTLSLPTVELTPLPAAPETAPLQEATPAEWKTLTVRSGDNLSLLFQRAGLDHADVHEFISSGKDAKALTRLFPGHQLAFLIDEQGDLQQLRHVINPLDSKLYHRTQDGFVAEDSSREPDTHLAYREARITSSLYMAAKSPDIGLDDATVDQLATIFGWDIDFGLDIRKGDSFKVLFEEQFLDGEKIGNGNILAAEFTNQGRSVQAVRYEHEDGSIHYYTPEGKSMRKEFLQTPLNFRYISSNFNPNRLHPIHKTVRPHRGTDYAADRGTPVWSAGDGKVIEAGYSRANGNYVFIQHGADVVTRYLHLHNKHVKKGDRVRQKQVIGTVGSTGYATGPHLHYEFLMNGVHRNPRTIISKLPQAKSIAGAEMLRFSQQISPLLAQLDEFHQATQLALAGSGDSNVQ
ncbi:peptidoglycan DD-metalloendopeptidase family protein [Proteobacteria bacterium 005FR1]|nr:peptidoglycan DD-metalloendopeptidase family protein [Proteobacteria bacterium 005FR1]